ncbi:MAG: T9SS type A sorting domain-containing protein, partial [Ignavibacteria bacterium]|nr:T9SS type A sorting domain-containing protein [Ignavibacteria bacterium]
IAVDKSGGPRNGWIYSVTCEKDMSPAGTDPDVILHKSTDGGITWSAGIRVNRDALNNGKIQYFPAIDVDENGGINIIYYDTRNTPSNDSVQVYLSRSQDGGNNWKDFIISGNKFYPQPVLLGGAGNQGDNISIASANNKLYPVWMARYPGESVYQIWSSVIDINSVGINKISENVPQKFDLHQNYPNPFNPKTKIRYNVPVSSDVTINIYNINGRLMQTLVNGNHNPGEYEVDFDYNTSGGIFSSGVYFYRLITDNNVITRKMILTK